MTTVFNEEAMHSWIQLNHPEHCKNLESAETDDTLTFLAKSASPSVMAPSAASITGPGAAAAKANTTWADNPVLGAINMAQMARNAAGYNPADLNNAGATSTQYNDFIKRLVTCPLYNVKLSDSKHIEQETSDWNTLISAIADTFEGIAAKDKGTIESGLKSLATAASSKMETTQKQALFVQNAITVDGTITLNVYSSYTTFYEKKGKGYDTKSNTFDVTRLQLEFQKDLWPQWWEKVKNAFDGTVDDWINDNKTNTDGASPIPALSGS
jgi:hypothetical protein